MNTLFDLETIPTVEAQEKPVKPKANYYLRRQSNTGEWYFLWKTHTNGGCEWRPESELTINGGRMKPLRYKTLSGASRMLTQYIGTPAHGGVAVWKDTK